MFFIANFAREFLKNAIIIHIIHKKMSTQTEKIKELVELRVKARLGGGEKAIAKQHEKGKYTARERIAMLLDD